VSVSSSHCLHYQFLAHLKTQEQLIIKIKSLICGCTEVLPSCLNFCHKNARNS
jgi:hypothetical protein